MALRPRSIEAPAVYARLFEQAKERLPGADRPWLQAIRKEGFEAFHAQGFPTQRVEAWKYSNLNSLARIDFRLPSAPGLTEADLAPWLFEAPSLQRLVFVDGVFVPGLSRIAPADGMSVRRLADIVESDEAAARTLFAATDDGERSFSALNAAFVGDGVLIDVAPGVTVDGPVHLLHVISASAEPAMVNLRHSVRVGADARLDLVESHVALEGSAGLTNLLTRYELGANAHLGHDRLQFGHGSGHLIGRAEIDMAEDAVLDQTVATLGYGFVRNETHGTLSGRNGHLKLAGLFFGQERQHIDTVIQIDHAVPDCESDQFYKGVLDDRAHGAFAGKIHVHRDAQKTNAYQANDNLLLSEHAEIDTKPELEIYADDVKCSHGATAGEIDETELFYLRSRGLDPVTARSMLTFGFVGAVLDRFNRPEVVPQVRVAIADRLPGGEGLKDMA
ncbi:Fe-S cluster assembly protein SufD [Marinivivus vitaminiproducens]|uniref:Fe-S cluster assembly protein SufD n=1 Tax=Marinivivus vitaminiproducens TaxID=3035935 RepID=UPI00279CB606|nr:Fe-S cluster assembly protein SufD [Geminicoccaceae bacterium SCSIO 64248]